AVEKAGIVKPGVPVVLGVMPEEARTAIESIANERGARVLLSTEGVSIEVLAAEPQRTLVTLRTPRRDYGELSVGLPGQHQVQTAVVAGRVLEGLPGDWVIPVDAIKAGLARVRWPGRLEVRRWPDGREAILDAAHNADGAAALARFLSNDMLRRPIVFA